MPSIFLKFFKGFQAGPYTGHPVFKMEGWGVYHCYLEKLKEMEHMGLDLQSSGLVFGCPVVLSETIETFASEFALTHWLSAAVVSLLVLSWLTKGKTKLKLSPMAMLVISVVWGVSMALILFAGLSLANLVIFLLYGDAFDGPYIVAFLGWLLAVRNWVGWYKNWISQKLPNEELWESDFVVHAVAVAVVNSLGI